MCHYVRLKIKCGGLNELLIIKLQFLHPRNLSFSFAFMLLYAYSCQSYIMGGIYGNLEWTCARIQFTTDWNLLTHTFTITSDVYEVFVNQEKSFREGLFRRKSLSYLLVYLRMFHEWDPLGVWIIKLYWIFCNIFCNNPKANGKILLGLFVKENQVDDNLGSLAYKYASLQPSITPGEKCHHAFFAGSKRSVECHSNDKNVFVDTFRAHQITKKWGEG